MSVHAGPGRPGAGRRLVPFLVALTLACGKGPQDEGAGAGQQATDTARAAGASVTTAVVPDPATFPGDSRDVVPEAPLEDTEWRLVALPGTPDPPAQGHATLVLEREGGLLRGSTGCNGFGGSWQIAGTRLMLGLDDLGARGCGPDLARLEVDYLEALRRVGSYRLRGDTLELLGNEGVVARFEAP